MRNLFYLVIAFLMIGCASKSVEINGTAKNMDGDEVSILDLKDLLVFSETITSGKFTIKKPLPSTGYYTFSVIHDSHPRDFEIYLEPGKYTIDIPQKDGDYLKINTTSQTQTRLSAYYNFENDIMAPYWHEVDIWKAKLNDPKIKDLPEAEFQEVLDHIELNRNREAGLHIAVMDSFIKKYPTSDIIPHIITNMNYKSYPYPYYNLYKKLKPEVQNSEEGKKIGEELKVLAKKG